MFLLYDKDTLQNEQNTPPKWQQYFLRDDETLPSKYPFSRAMKLFTTDKS